MTKCSCLLLLFLCVLIKCNKRASSSDAVVCHTQYTANPVGWRLYNTLTASLQRGKILPTIVLD